MSSPDSKPVIADTQPAVLTLAAGRYAHCSCGRSAKQPFCDGSHGGTGFRPQWFELTEEKTVALCNCKHSQNGHLCDGSHKGLI